MFFLSRRWRFFGQCLVCRRCSRAVASPRISTTRTRTIRGPCAGRASQKSPCFPEDRKLARCRTSSLLARRFACRSWLSRGRNTHIAASRSTPDSCLAPRIDKRTNNRARGAQNTTLPKMASGHCGACVHASWLISLRTRHTHRSRPRALFIFGRRVLTGCHGRAPHVTRLPRAGTSTPQR